MKVRYNPIVGSFLLALGVLCLFLNLWLAALGDEDYYIGALAGLLVTVMGVLHLVRPVLTVQGNQLRIYPLIGPARKPMEFTALEADGGKLFAIGADGTRKRVPVQRWVTRSGDWAVAFGNVPQRAAR